MFTLIWYPLKVMRIWLQYFPYRQNILLSATTTSVYHLIKDLKNSDHDITVITTQIEKKLALIE